MLTQDALEERKWGPFPALRQALEDKPLPHDFYGFTSISDNSIDRLRRLLETAMLARTYAAAVKETAQSVGPDQIHRDLQALESEFRGACSMLENEIQEIRRLHDTL